MARKGGLAAIMAGETVVKKKKTTMVIVKSDEVRRETEKKYNSLVKSFISKAEEIKDSTRNETKLDSLLTDLIDEHTEQLFLLFDSPISLNYFDSLFYSNGEYNHLWTMDSALFFTSTTMVPVGFGLITPLTSCGRFFLCVYAMIGIPLALVTMSDIGRFACNAMLRLCKENMSLFVIWLSVLLIFYPLVGGFCIHLASEMSLSDSIYYCIITILTVGFGDIDPPVPIFYLIMFILVGVTLMTISVEVIATHIIHNIHYMGRQMGKAKDVAAKMISMAQKISINRGLGLGMAQLGAFARMGVMINVDGTATVSAEAPPPLPVPDEEKERKKERMSSAFDPDIDFDLIDTTGGADGVFQNAAFNNGAFRYFDEDDCFQ